MTAAKIIRADMRKHHWRTPNGQRCTFEPNSKIRLVGKTEPFERNPAAWESEDPMLAARIFVGFNVGGAATYSVDDLIPVVVETRQLQGHDPDSSFLIQKGVYTSKKSGETVTEDSAQVVILNTAGSPYKEFEHEMIILAETIAAEMQQEEVIVEIQEGGISKRTFGVVP